MRGQGISLLKYSTPVRRPSCAAERSCGLALSGNHNPRAWHPQNKLRYWKEIQTTIIDRSNKYMFDRWVINHVRTACKNPSSPTRPPNHPTPSYRPLPKINAQNLGTSPRTPTKQTKPSEHQLATATPTIARPAINRTTLKPPAIRTVKRRRTQPAPAAAPVTPIRRRLPEKQQLWLRCLSVLHVRQCAWLLLGVHGVSGGWGGKLICMSRAARKVSNEEWADVPMPLRFEKCSRERAST